MLLQVSSIEIERICNRVDSSILETAAIGVPPPDGGPEQLVIAVVFKDATKSLPVLNELKTSFNSALQKQLNPLFRVSFLSCCSAVFTLFSTGSRFFTALKSAGFSRCLTAVSPKNSYQQGYEKGPPSAIRATFLSIKAVNQVVITDYRFGYHKSC